MNIDNKISAKRIKSALNLRTVLTVMLIVVLVSIVFYVTAENIDSKDILIWFITEDADVSVSNEILAELNDYGADKGIDKIVLTKRHPDDQYFDVTMSTSAYYSCDVFIMNKEMIEKYAELDMFLPLSDADFDSEQLYYVGECPVGVLMFEDYYLLVNRKTDIELEIIYNTIDILIESK